MKIKYIIAAFTIAALFAGCKNAYEYTPSIYITEAQKEMAKTITISEAGEKAELSVSSSKPVDKDTHVKLTVLPELLDEYNARYGRTCVLLDTDSYEFGKQEVTIAAGSHISDAGSIVVTKELEPGTFYCLPVCIESTDGDMPILQASSTLYLIFRAPVKSKAVYIGSANKYIVPSFYYQDGSEGGRDLSALPELTLECRVMANAFRQTDPYISSIMGLEGNVCIRFGDVKIGWDVVQVCHGDYQPAAINAPCATSKWYHVAAVWSRNALRIFIDGQFITETPHQGETVDLSIVHIWGSNPSIGFGLGAASNYNNHRPLNGYLAEARVWTRALTNSEIANINDLVIVDPQSPGLLAYWKMNDAETISEYESNSRWTLQNRIPDLTGNGYDALGQSAAPTFIDAIW